MRLIVIIPAMVFLTLVASAGQDYLSGLVDSLSSNEQDIMDEYRQHVFIPCAMAFADGDVDRANRLAEVHQDKLPQWSKTFMYTSDRGVRLAAYPAWRDECIYRQGKMHLADTVSKHVIKEEVWEHATFPCLKHKTGRAGDDAVNFIKDVIKESGRGHIDDLVQSQYEYVKATESKDTRMAAYQVMYNQCVSIR